MIRRPPRSTRTDTLFPYTTLFRSRLDLAVALGICLVEVDIGRFNGQLATVRHCVACVDCKIDQGVLHLRWVGKRLANAAHKNRLDFDVLTARAMQRSAEGRVGKECSSTCSCVWSRTRIRNKKR